MASMSSHQLPRRKLCLWQLSKAERALHSDALEFGGVAGGLNLSGCLFSFSSRLLPSFSFFFTAYHLMQHRVTSALRWVSVILFHQVIFHVHVFQWCPQWVGALGRDTGLWVDVPVVMLWLSRADKAPILNLKLLFKKLIQWCVFSSMYLEYVRITSWTTGD